MRSGTRASSVNDIDAVVDDSGVSSSSSSDGLGEPCCDASFGSDAIDRFAVDDGGKYWGADQELEKQKAAQQLEELFNFGDSESMSFPFHAEQCSDVATPTPAFDLPTGDADFTNALEDLHRLLVQDSTKHVDMDKLLTNDDRSALFDHGEAIAELALSVADELSGTSGSQHDGTGPEPELPVLSSNISGSPSDSSSKTDYSESTECGALPALVTSSVGHVDSPITPRSFFSTTAASPFMIQTLITPPATPVLYGAALYDDDASASTFNGNDSIPTVKSMPTAGNKRKAASQDIYDSINPDSPGGNTRPSLPAQAMGPSCATLMISTGNMVSVSGFNGISQENRSVSMPHSLQMPFDPKNLSCIAPQFNAAGKLICPFAGCDRQFDKKTLLVSHLVVHTDDRPYSCHFCSAKFSRNHDLLRHNRTVHHPARRQKCDCCNAFFENIPALVEHRAFCKGKDDKRTKKRRIYIRTEVFVVSVKKKMVEKAAAASSAAEGSEGVSAVQSNSKKRKSIVPSQAIGAAATARKNTPTFNTIAWNERARNPSRQNPEHPTLAAIPSAHIESFNSIFSYAGAADDQSGLEVGSSAMGLLDLAVKDIGKIVVFDGDQSTLSEVNGWKGRNKLEMWIDSVTVARPMFDSPKQAEIRPVYPAECRERKSTYKGKIQLNLKWCVNGGPVQSEIRQMGSLPIMVRSNKCSLQGKTPAQMVRHHEDSGEFGGYFIINGNERLIRLLIVPRRNHPVALVRPSFVKRGPTYSQFGVQIRSCRMDNSSQTMTLHYLTDGALNLRFSYKKSEYLVPVLLILRALKDCSDHEIFERIVSAGSGGASNTFLTDRVELLLRSFQRFAVVTRQQCLAYIGSKFHVMLDSPEDMTEEEVGKEFLKRIVLVHLSSDKEKFDLLFFMIQKLYALVAGECATDNPDSPQHQEILLGGHLYLNHFKEKLVDWLASLKLAMTIDLRRNPGTVDFNDRKYILKVLSKSSSDLGKGMEFFLATGNLKSKTGLDLQQVSGYTIIAEKLNFYRYVSHFHSVHRGAFFAELKTTTVRKLLPEAWGFLCPVHTPDGSPCGLLNHLSRTCKIVIGPLDVSALPSLILSLGVSQAIGSGAKRIDDDDSEKTKRRDRTDDGNEVDPEEWQRRVDQMIISVQLDGRVIGHCTSARAKEVAAKLRHLKFSASSGVPLDLEIGLVLPSRKGQYPGLFLFSTPARMMRPVTYLVNGKEDRVGSFEQVYMNIACISEDVVPGLTTHMEIHPTAILSVVASLTPFSDFNQSPRNMYQCQMGKQAMGTPANNFPNRTDNKLYRLQTGQTPVVRPTLHTEYGMDDYPNGMNAVVCVIAYTGYDMEDASIISKSSHDRGYGYGTVYKSEFIDLSERRKPGEPITSHFGTRCPITGTSVMWSKVKDTIGVDGLPLVGAYLSDGDPFYCVIDDLSNRVKIEYFKGMESAYVDEVRLIGTDGGDQELQKVHIKLRIPRPAIIGDKFSSRHGQKGVISQKWPSVDMPFSESGIIPDVIINPHAFPSRMTIGMFVESIAGKSGALHGRAQDATPFQFNEDHSAAEFFGEELKQAGFNYHGNEPMYSGITGKEFKADIYIGVVYYQRLRHMVSDKYQVRTTGPVNQLTQQPIKGRKKAGGIRLGEMERDSLLAHGVSFILQDRLMNCSDYSQCHICRLCGSILSPISVRARAKREFEATAAADSPGGKRAARGNERAWSAMENVVAQAGARGAVECLTCRTSAGIEVIAVPYVFRYLLTSLVAMNVRLKLEVSEAGRVRER